MFTEPLSELSNYLADQMGLHFPQERWRDLVRGIEAAAPELGFDNKERCIEWLLSSTLRKDQIEILASYLTVGETYFFRDEHTFDALEQSILPELIRQRRDQNQRVRIWSAGCCSGEEAYSIAIQLSQFLPDLKEWNITILATDINPRFLQRACDGIFSEWSFRASPSWVKDRYFRKIKEGRYEILPRLKRMVTFSYLNLAEDAYPSLANDTNAMDLIFCRNVLMYFSHRQIRSVVQKLYRAQTEGGWLIVSPGETSQTLFRPYITKNLPGVILYRKDTREAQAVDHRAAAAESEPLVFDEPCGVALAEQPPQMAIEQEQPPPQVRETQEAERFSLTYAEAAALYGQGRYAEAVDKLVDLATGPSPQPQVFNLLARALANQGKLAEALGWCNQAVSADKLNPANYYLRAVVLQEQGALAEAAGSLRRALYLDHHFVLAHFALGNLARHGGKARQADKHLKNALRILRRYRQDDVLPESEGITAGRLTEVITSLINLETGA